MKTKRCVEMNFSELKKLPPDPSKLRILADWFDLQESLHPEWSGSVEVQMDLRSWARNVDKLLNDSRN